MHRSGGRETVPNGMGVALRQTCAQPADATPICMSWPRSPEGTTSRSRRAEVDQEDSAIRRAVRLFEFWGVNTRPSVSSRRKACRGSIFTGPE